MPPADTIHRHPHPMPTTAIPCQVTSLMPRAAYEKLRRLARAEKQSLSAMVRILVERAPEPTR